MAGTPARHPASAGCWAARRYLCLDSRRAKSLGPDLLEVRIAGGLSRPGPSPPALRLGWQHPMHLGQGRTKAGLW